MHKYQHKAQAIMIGDRYFCKFGKGGRVMTAWSLAGADLFLHQDRIEAVTTKLDSKKKNYNVVSVGVVHA